MSDERLTHDFLDDEHRAANLLGQTYISKKKIMIRLLQAACISGVSAAAAYGITQSIKHDKAVSQFSSALVAGISFFGSLATCCYAKGIKQAKNLGIFKEYYTDVEPDEGLDFKYRREDYSDEEHSDDNKHWVQ